MHVSAQVKDIAAASLQYEYIPMEQVQQDTALRSETCMSGIMGQENDHISFVFHEFDHSDSNSDTEPKSQDTSPVSVYAQQAKNGVHGDGYAIDVTAPARNRTKQGGWKHQQYLDEHHDLQHGVQQGEEARRNTCHADMSATNGNRGSMSASNGNIDPLSTQNGNRDPMSASNGNRDPMGAQNGNRQQAGALNGNRENMNAQNGNRDHVNARNGTRQPRGLSRRKSNESTVSVYEHETAVSAYENENGVSAYKDENTVSPFETYRSDQRKKDTVQRGPSAAFGQYYPDSSDSTSVQQQHPTKASARVHMLDKDSRRDSDFSSVYSHSDDRYDYETAPQPYTYGGQNIPAEKIHSNRSTLDSNFRNYENMQYTRENHDLRRNLFLSSAAHRMSIRSWGSSDILSPSRATRPGGFAVGLAGSPWNEEAQNRTQTPNNRDQGRFLHHTAKARVTSLVSDADCVQICPKYRSSTQYPSSSGRLDHSCSNPKSTWVCLHTQSVHDMSDVHSIECEDMTGLRPMLKTQTPANRVSSQNSFVRQGMHMHFSYVAIYVRVCTASYTLYIASYRLYIASYTLYIASCT
jgi:hypothetical protein